CVGFLLLVSLVISAVISGLQNYMNNWLPGIPWVWQTANVVSSFFVIAILFAMIYKFLPDVVISWKDVWIGAAVTALLFTAGKYLIGIYLGRTATASAFGAAARSEERRVGKRCRTRGGLFRDRKNRASNGRLNTNITHAL